MDKHAEEALATSMVALVAVASLARMLDLTLPLAIATEENVRKLHELGLGSMRSDAYLDGLTEAVRVLQTALGTRKAG